MHRGDFEDIAAATGHDDEMNEWEDGELSQWKGQGWTLSKAAKLMWRGERDPHRVTRNVDRNSSHVVLALLEAFVERDCSSDCSSGRGSVDSSRSWAGPSTSTQSQPGQTQAIGVRDARKVIHDAPEPICAPGWPRSTNAFAAACLQYNIGGTYTFKNGKSSAVRGEVVAIAVMARPKPDLPHARLVTIQPEDADAELYDSFESSTPAASPAGARRPRSPGSRLDRKVARHKGFMDEIVADPEHPALQHLYAAHPEVRRLVFTNREISRVRRSSRYNMQVL